MVNDTMIRYSPETGYPVTEPRRRRRIKREGLHQGEPLGRKLVRWLMQALAAVLLLAAALWLGLGVAGNITTLRSAEASATAGAVLDGEWASGATTEAPVYGKPWARISIPAIGLLDEVVLEGTEDDQINVGVGHYVQTSLPGAAGTFGLAGHRTGWGEPFRELHLLRPGDQVIVETVDRVYTYTVTGGTVVVPTETWVLGDVPPEVTGASGEAQLLTLTTCEGGDNEERLIAWGELTSISEKA